MRNFVPSLRTRLMVRAAAIALVAGSVAACSSDSSRFSESPFSNPFSSASNDAPRQERQRDTYATGSVQAAPTSRVERAPLSAPSDVQQRPMYGYGNGGQSPSGGSYRTSSLPPVQQRSEPVSTGSVSGRSSEGMTVTLGRGETITSTANRYGVPASAIMRANGLQSANGIGEGSRLIIPTYVGGGYSRTAAAPLRPAAPVASPIATTRPAPLRPQPVAVAAPAERGTAAQPRMQLVQGAQPKVAEAKPVAAPAPVKPAPALKPSVAPEQRQAFAAQPAKPVTPQASESDNVKTAALKVDPAPAAPSVADSGPSFRWPVRGRVISGYGSKTSGASNDGVNIAVPEGTDVKASDDGVVAYSGSELKGFGNLVLIRHSNGWVTAYAHNSALNVKRGETVRRGQIIAKSGSTGSVSSPQLHFEVRKGASTVDPMKHLPDV
jgi:murein DD-endopeptidase MepM/ murein hydrolase activator NlpD